MQLGEITEPKIDQAGPPQAGEFTYVDISSVDNKTKRIVEPKRLPADSAPSRARQRLRSGDVLVSMTRPNLNAVALVPPKLDGAIGSTGFHVLRARDNVLPQWLYYGVQTRQFVGAMSELVQGALYPAVRPKDIRAFDLPLPELEEQRRIVAEIEMQFSRLDEAVANLKRVKANLKRYKTAVLKAAVEGRLVESEAELARREGQGYHSAAELLVRILREREAALGSKGRKRRSIVPSSSDLPPLPDGWVWCSISQVCDVASGNTPVGVLDAVRPSGELPWFKVGDMNHAENQQVMCHADSWLSSAQAQLLGLRIFPPRTVLFPKRGGAISTNKKRLLNGPACADLNVMGITPFAGLEPYFRLWFDGVDLSKLSDGSNVPQINHKDIDPLPIPLPPLAEQQRIAAEAERLLSVGSEVEGQVAANARRCNLLRHAILSAAFRDIVPDE